MIANNSSIVSKYGTGFKELIEVNSTDNVKVIYDDDHALTGEPVRSQEFCVMKPQEDFLKDVFPVTQHITRGFKCGRNEPCPCGSGLKYKRCHGLNK